MDGVDRSLQVLEILEAVLRGSFSLCLRGLFVILVLMNADDNRLLLFVDISELAVCLFVLGRDLILDIGAESVLHLILTIL